MGLALDLRTSPNVSSSQVLFSARLKSRLNHWKTRLERRWSFCAAPRWRLVDSDNACQSDWQSLRSWTRPWSWTRSSRRTRLSCRTRPSSWARPWKRATDRGVLNTIWITLYHCASLKNEVKTVFWQLLFFPVDLQYACNYIGRSTNYAILNSFLGGLSNNLISFSYLNGIYWPLMPQWSQLEAEVPRVNKSSTSVYMTKGSWCSHQTASSTSLSTFYVVRLSPCMIMWVSL